jgi:REP-associated tyrosine transposase
MPNHVHGIVRLLEGNTTALGQIIRTFKSNSATKIGRIRNGVSDVWQRNYYERIIRNERELNLIRLYIDLNRRMWREGNEFAEISFRSEEDIGRLLEKYR